MHEIDNSIVIINKTKMSFSPSGATFHTFLHACTHFHSWHSSPSGSTFHTFLCSTRHPHTLPHSKRLLPESPMITYVRHHTVIFTSPRILSSVCGQQFKVIPQSHCRGFRNQFVSAGEWVRRFQISRALFIEDKSMFRHSLPSNQSNIIAKRASTLWTKCFCRKLL